MFDNIGGKIKGLAMMFCWIGILSCIFVGIAIILIDENLVPVGLIVALAGSFFSWTGSFLLYGFGQLVENSDIIAHQSQTSVTLGKSHSVEAKKKVSEESTGKIPQKLDVPKTEFTEIQCPNCREILSFPKAMISPNETLVCPFCDKSFHPKGSQ